MQFLLTFCFVILVTMTAFGQTVDQKVRHGNTFKQLDPIVNGIGVSSNYDNIIAKIGNPVNEVADPQVDECTGGTTKTLTYDGFEIEMNFDTENAAKNGINSFVITSGKWKLDSGIKIGDSRAKFLKTYVKKAKPSNEEASGAEVTYEVLEKYGPGTISFFFDNNKLVKIELRMTLC